MTTFGVSLLSGGLDSTTVTAYAKGQVDRLTALTFHYGQTHSKEVDCAKRVASVLGVEHVLVDIGFLGQVAWHSALTRPDLFPIPKGRSAKEIGFGVPITYVPLRNTIFLALAAAHLESTVLHAMESEGMKPEQVRALVYMAPNAIDYSGYPDCRPEFFTQAAETLRLGSKLWTQYKVGFEVETPIIRMSKAEIVKIAVRLKAPLGHTWSCYEGGEVPCGTCDSCLLRAQGFVEAGVADPLLAKEGKS
jgi:7-cyano-7-deazaguanine synthase